MILGGLVKAKHQLSLKNLRDAYCVGMVATQHPAPPWKCAGSTCYKMAMIANKGWLFGQRGDHPVKGLWGKLNLIGRHIWMGTIAHHTSEGGAKILEN